jgi:hypothetical protein
MRTDVRTNMTTVIAAIVTAVGLGKLMAFHLVNKFLTFYRKKEFVTVLKNPSLGSILNLFNPDPLPRQTVCLRSV